MLYASEEKQILEDVSMTLEAVLLVVLIQKMQELYVEVCVAFKDAFQLVQKISQTAYFYTQTQQ